MNKQFKFFLSEALATFILVLIGCGTAIFVLSYQTPMNLNPLTPLLVALGFFTAVIILAYTTGYFANGHANPSVTIGHVFAGKLSWVDAAYHFLGQFAGAILAGFSLLTIYNFKTGPEVINLGSNAIPTDGSWLTAGIWELAITFLFVTVILHVTNKKNIGVIAPFLIAATLAALIFISLPTTGGSLNAARSFGVAIFNGGQSMKDLWVFLVFPTIGGALAGAVFKSLSSDSE